MHVTYQSRLTSLPGDGQIRKAHGNSRDSRPAGIEDSINACQHSCSKQKLSQSMEVHWQIDHEGEAIDAPRKEGRNEKETQQSRPDRGDSIENSHRCAGV